MIVRHGRTIYFDFETRSQIPLDESDPYFSFARKWFDLVKDSLDNGPEVNTSDGMEASQEYLRHTSFRGSFGFEIRDAFLAGYKAAKNTRLNPEYDYLDVLVFDEEVIQKLFDRAGRLIGVIERCPITKEQLEKQYPVRDTAKDGQEVLLINFFKDYPEGAAIAPPIKVYEFRCSAPDPSNVL